jgi:hypothetical protein
METTKIPSPPVLSSPEVEKLRQALESQYPDRRSILGSQLGSFIRSQLTNAWDLKGRFGGLKNFVARYFPTEISWRGRQGLDDLYDISFSKDEHNKSSQHWRIVAPEGASWLWSAVTNPAINVQFAWLAKEQALMQAPTSVPLMEGLVAVGKLTKADYQNIARSFVRSMKNIDTSSYLQVIDSSGSSVEFTTMIREQGLLSRWEEFRVDNALRLFTDRLQASGADSREANRWTDLLRVSRQEVRSQRSHKASTPATSRKPTPLLTPQTNASEIPQTRAVAMKTIEFLSDAELAELKLPLGSVMHAFRTLSRTN